MALQWFLQAIGTKMVNCPKSGEVEKWFPSKLSKDMRIVNLREAEGTSHSNHNEIYCSSGRVNGGGTWCAGFQMPLHYPRYRKEDYQRMEERKVDILLREYGLACVGSLEEKRAYAMGAFLWPEQI
ncbi:uncharacterized protein A4U43_C10F300 [Asparagus officinalis]|uniref:DUF7722 domain-containing protein n=1 Tax=Asparagus officinalis TaxID=4686 RepID=A0A5P1E005_ASPOF|nr:uncharacterized protein LOC109826354 [Asparagus officinalis]XP_020259946.1 uncharacterized protein LOC109836462 [Asparagus officinalis]ONK55719.1 uncharacterized protein A4U43_C10F300 [Asparagus officinalis]